MGPFIIGPFYAKPRAPQDREPPLEILSALIILRAGTVADNSSRFRPSRRDFTLPARRSWLEAQSPEIAWPPSAARAIELVSNHDLSTAPMLMNQPSGDGAFSEGW